MKTISKLAFGVNAVVSGQKSSVVNAEPTLTANSTSGKFSVTSPVTKALGVANGEYIQFFNNIQGVEDAISARNEMVVAFCEEKNLDIESSEAHAAIMQEFVQWFIGKGVAQYDSKGNPKLASERYTKEDKEKFIAEHGMEIVAANRDALIARLGNPDATDEELLASITVEDVETPKTQAYSGAKATNVSGKQGVGLPLNFTDSATWDLIKSDLEDKKSVNRVFDVLLDEAVEVDYNNGKEIVKVKVLPIVFKEDVAPIERKSKDAKNADDAEL